MTNIKSSIGANKGNPVRTFKVDDESTGEDLDFLNGLADGERISPASAAALRKRGQQASKELSENDKGRLDFLLGLGRVYKTVEIDAGDRTVSITLKSLKSKEMSYLMNYWGKLSIETDKSNAAQQIFDVRAAQLAFALHSIDNVLIDTLLESEDKTETERLERRMVLINEFDDVTVIYLHGVFSGLRNELEKKYGIKTDKDVKEVAETISKSG